MNEQLTTDATPGKTKFRPIKLPGSTVRNDDAPVAPPTMRQNLLTRLIQIAMMQQFGVIPRRDMAGLPF